MQERHPVVPPALIPVAHAVARAQGQVLGHLPAARGVCPGLVAPARQPSCRDGHPPELLGCVAAEVRPGPRAVREEQPHPGAAVLAQAVEEVEAGFAVGPSGANTHAAKTRSGSRRRRPGRSGWLGRVALPRLERVRLRLGLVCGWNGRAVRAARSGSPLRSRRFQGTEWPLDAAGPASFEPGHA